VSRVFILVFYLLGKRGGSIPGHGKPGPTSPARPGPKISGLGHVFWPDGRAWAAEMRPDCLLGPGLGSRFGGFWEGPARKPDGPTKNSSLGLGLGRFFRPDSRAGPGLGSHFRFWALSWPGPTRPGPRGCPGIGGTKRGEVLRCYLEWSLELWRAWALPVRHLKQAIATWLGLDACSSTCR
jgi:hypothetical protein